MSSDLHLTLKNTCVWCKFTDSFIFPHFSQTGCSLVQTGDLTGMQSRKATKEQVAQQAIKLTRASETQNDSKKG